MSSASWNNIPEKRREAILRRRQAEEAAAAAGKKNPDKHDRMGSVDEDYAKTPEEDSISAVLARRRSGGSGGWLGGEEPPIVKEHSAKIEKLEKQVEELVERNKQLEDLLSKVLAQLGITNTL